jgi:hypothetical protein
MPWWNDGLVGWWLHSDTTNTLLARIPWWNDGLVGWWLHSDTMNTLLARWLGGMMAWLVGGFIAIRLIVCLQDAWWDDWDG